MSSAVAVATCRPTRNARKNDSGWAWAAARLSHPKIVGRITAWPRLEMGNSSVTPWITPITTAWKYVIMCASHRGAPEDIVSGQEPSTEDVSDGGDLRVGAAEPGRG